MLRSGFRSILPRLVCLALGFASPLRAEPREIQVGGFVTTHDLTVAGTPQAVFDAITGDIRPWWDHTFSENPKALFIEAEPGGRFYETFNDAGDGVVHASVIYAERGKLLRMEGPLGLSGHAIQMVFTYTFEAAGPESTRLHFEGHAAGEMDPSWPGVVDGVWHHFLVERFKPYMDAKAGK